MEETRKHPASGGEIEYVMVGKRYPGEWKSMQEGGHYSYNAAGHMLQLHLPGATDTEVRDVRAGRAEFALAVEGPVIFLLFRFGRQPWSEAPFSVHLVPKKWRRTTLRTADTGERRNMLRILLIDTRSGILKAIRVCGLSAHFIDAFELALQGQPVSGWAGRDAYDMAIAEVYRRNPYGCDNLVRGAVAHCAVPAR